MAKYIGSGALGLGLYHIDIPESVMNPIASTKNCGIVLVEEGSLSAMELAEEFSKIYKTNWPWKVRELGVENTFLVKFPPHIVVEQVTGYPKFGVSKPCVWVKVEAWNDDLEPVESLKKVWVIITGLQTKWCEWNTLDQAASICGILEEVDWKSIFRNNAKEVRVLIKCKDPSKLPVGRLFNFQDHLFYLGFALDSSVLVVDEEDDLLTDDQNGQNRGNGEDLAGQRGGEVTLLTTLAVEHHITKQTIVHLEEMVVRLLIELGWQQIPHVVPVLCFISWFREVW
uniref:Uncharacterized protein n=1 Tax=Avena sativa TaxID=4498 RepID=A0ACD5Y6C6_AVESA